MKLGIIIFARSSSTRFKGKVLKKINNVSILEIIHQRLLKVSKKKNLPIIIATTNNPLDLKIVKLCKKKNFKYFRGSENNVLNRAIKCCEKFNLNAFVRICADRPFLDYGLLKKMINVFYKNKFDIVTNTFPKTFSYGLTFEIIRISSIKKMKSKQTLSSDKEHILNYFYRNSNEFKIKNFFNKNKKNKNFKLSLDTKKDLSFFKKIFKENNFNFLIKTNSVIKSLN